MKRIVRCLGSSVIQAHPKEEAPWADVWISWVPSKHAKREMYGPTLIGKYDLRGELVMMRELAEENPTIKEYARDAKLYERILADFDSGKTVFLELGGKNPGCPNIYTSADGINRAEAEKMLTALLQTKGVMEPVFDWVKPKHIVGAMTFGHIAEGKL